MSKVRKEWARSIEDRDAFWAEQAQLIDWETPFEQVFDGSSPPRSRWYVGGKTNLCYNAVDRHAMHRPDAPALIFVSGEQDIETLYSFSQLQSEVEKTAALMRSLGVSKGDRVLIYMPMIAQAAFVMLACTRIGAIHSVVFGGFAAGALADRIDDLGPKLIFGADAGLRGGKVIAYQPLIEGALSQSTHQPEHVVMVNRGLDKDYAPKAGRDVDYDSAIAALEDVRVPVTWLESSEPSYVLYTSGTTGKPKGVERDTGGYAAALTASMRHIYNCQPGDTMFSTSDIGWVVGHSYIVYGPLLNGMATIFYEGTPIHPDPGIWWRIVEKYKPSVMFSAPTAMRLLKKYDPAIIQDRDLSSLRHVFLAGEPLDEPTAQWATRILGRDVFDHYWQTETGWPIISAQPGIEAHTLKWGSPSYPVYGFDLAVIDPDDGHELPAGEKGLLSIKWPLPPGTMTTVWGDDARFGETYFRKYGADLYYLTFDFALQDSDGYVFLHGRSDDVINVAGHRLGTPEIEGAISSYDGVVECAVVGVADSVKGQTPAAFVVMQDGAEGDHARAIKAVVDGRLGAIARPSQIFFVPGLPKTRSGKVLRRALQAICEGRDTGDLPTIDNMDMVDAARTAVNGPAPSA